MTDKQQIKMTSTVIYNNTLYEQVYDIKKNISYYIGWDEQKQETIPIDSIENGNIKYLQIQDDLLQKQAVILPTKPLEYESEEI